MKKTMIFIMFIIVFLVLFIGLYFSPIGNNFVEKYVISKICFEKKFQPVYFKHSLTSFSLILKNDENIMQIYGKLFPFKADFNAKISNLNSLVPSLQGKIFAMGEINKDGRVKGNVFFAKGEAILNLICQKNNIKGEIKGKNFNTYYFLKMFKNLNFKEFNLSLKGINDLNIKFNGNVLLNANFIGYMIIFGKKIPVKITNLFNYTNKKFSYKGIIESEDIKGLVTINKNADGIEYSAKFDKINLKFFKNIFLIPVQKKVALDIFYNTLNKVYDFQSQLFSGFYKNKILVLQFKMPSHYFFELLSLPEIFDGGVIGNVRVFGKNGKINLLMENAIIKKDIFEKLQKYINIKYNTHTKGKIFVTGKFDKEKIIFDFISKDLNYYWSIKNGIYYFNGKFKFILKLSDGKYIYLFKINNNDIRLLKKIDKHQATETLVY